ncbi:MAG: hypothetical protein U0172_12480 [Nitrospiraceae bacterium]
MKYLIIHGEGLTRGAESTNQPTVLEAAATPHLDTLAKRGEFGWVAVPVEGTAPIGELTGLSVLAYDPKKYSTGPAPLEAVGLGISVGDHDVVYRVHFVTLRSEHAPAGKQANADAKKLSPLSVLEDATAGDIDTESARELVDALNEGMGSETIQFYPGADHRHYMVWVNGKSRATTRDPQLVQGSAVGEHLPSGDGDDVLRKLMDASVILLRDHPINLDRRETGQPTATCAWLWGQGRAPQWPPLPDKLGLSGSMVSTSPLLKGVGTCAGFESVDVEPKDSNATSLLSALAQAAASELSRRDIVYVHASLPVLLGNEGGESAAADAKAERARSVAAVEAFDRLLVGPLTQVMTKHGGRTLVVCDPADARGVDRAPTYQALSVLADSDSTAERVPDAAFNERLATERGGAARDALKLLIRLVKK